MPGVDQTPWALAPGDPGNLLDEAVLGQLAEVEGARRRAFADEFARLGGRQRSLGAEDLEERDPHRVGDRAHRSRIGEFASARDRAAWRLPDPPGGWRDCVSTSMYRIISLERYLCKLWSPLRDRRRTIGVAGARRDRAERVAAGGRPWNLIRVMPAQGAHRLQKAALRASCHMEADMTEVIDRESVAAACSEHDRQRAPCLRAGLASRFAGPLPRGFAGADARRDRGHAEPAARASTTQAARTVIPESRSIPRRGWPRAAPALDPRARRRRGTVPRGSRQRAPRPRRGRGHPAALRAQGR